MRFSERHGLVSPRRSFQKNELDTPTRNRLINEFTKSYLSRFTDRLLNDDGKAVFVRLLGEFFRKPIHSATDSYDTASKTLSKWASECEWYELLDLLEFIVQMRTSESYAQTRRPHFIAACNKIFEEEKVAYRFVKSQIVPIVDESEIVAIEQALAASDSFDGVRVHLNRALQLYSDRKSPDYRNTIKEAISAVESACRVISGKSGATLSDAIKIIEKKHTIHRAMKEAVIKLYGYTSDRQGIRHALVGDDKVGHAEAKLMLVGCSAFCNYLIEQCGE